MVLEGDPADQALPDPEAVKALMSAMSLQVQTIIDGLVRLAVAYGVHGNILTVGDTAFQLTRVSERWSVYVSSLVSGHQRDLLGSRLDEKVLFLEQSEHFVRDYRERIVSLYDKLRALRLPRRENP